MRSCRDCGARIGIRATRCADCRRKYRTAYERDRARTQRDESLYERHESPRYNGLDSDIVVDYTTPGSASRPPSFDVRKGMVPRWVREPGEISDGRVLSPQARWQATQPSLAGLPANVRQDYV